MGNNSGFIETGFLGVIGPVDRTTCWSPAWKGSGQFEKDAMDSMAPWLRAGGK